MNTAGVAGGSGVFASPDRLTGNSTHSFPGTAAAHVQESGWQPDRTKSASISQYHLTMVKDDPL